MFMKKMCSNLWRVLGKAVLACALVTPVLVTSCDKFDDSELKQDISNINEELSKINERIDKLETELREQVNSLTALINGKVSVVSCTKDAETGVTTVVLSDGSQFIVYPQSESADFSGITFLTTIEENGVLYWATSTVGGTPEALLVDGKKVPISSVQPDLKIENGKWYISVDGGKTWVETGVEEDNSGAVVSFFSNVTEDEDYVYLTLVSGTVVKVAKDKDVAFDAPFGKQYFANGETKKLALNMVGVMNYTVTEKPEGWKVRIDKKLISITAPAADNTSAETSGTIKVLATFDNASPIIAAISVTLEEADFILSIEGDQVSFTLAEKNVDNDEYLGYVCGALPKDEFTTAAAVEYLNRTFRYGGAHYETSTLHVSEVVGPTFDPELSYVVFATNKVDTWFGGSYSEDELQYMVYVPLKVNVEITPAFDNAYLKFSFSGCDAVYAGFYEAENYSKEYILGDLTSPWYSPDPVTEAYEGPVSKFNGGYDDAILFGTEYVFWYVVKNDSGEYTEDDVKEVPFSTFPLVAGGSLDAPFVEVVELKSGSVKANVVVVPGCYKTYARIFDKNDPWSYPKDEDEKLNRLLSWGWSASEGYIELTQNNLNPGAELEICAVAVDEKGNVGTMTQIEVTTPGLTFNDNLGVTIEEVEVGLTSVKVKFALKGDVTTLKYVCITSPSGHDTMESDIALGTAYPTKVSVSELVDNTLEITKLSLGTDYYFFVMAFDANGEFSHMDKTVITPKSDIVYIKRSADNWKYGKPEISNEVWGEDAWFLGYDGVTWYPSTTSLDVTVTLPAECKKAYLWSRDPAYLTSSTEISISDQAVAYGILVEESRVVRISDYMNSSTHIYFVWVDNNDQYHTYDEYIPTFPQSPAGE